MNRPNIPYNRAPKIGEMIDHLKYLIEQKKLFEDDIIIGIINHATKKKLKVKNRITIIRRFYSGEETSHLLFHNVQMMIQINLKNLRTTSRDYVLSVMQRK